MLVALYVLIFLFGIILGVLLCAGVIEFRYYGGEVNVVDEKFYTEDWIYDDPKRNFAVIKIERGVENEG